MTYTPFKTPFLVVWAETRSVLVLKSGQVLVTDWIFVAIVTVSVLHSLFIVLTLHGYVSLQI